jgi:hypothetical protein
MLSKSPASTIWWPFDVSFIHWENEWLCVIRNTLTDRNSCLLPVKHSERPIDNLRLFVIPKTLETCEIEKQLFLTGTAYGWTKWRKANEKTTPTKDSRQPANQQCLCLCLWSCLKYGEWSDSVWSCWKYGECEHVMWGRLIAVCCNIVFEVWGVLTFVLRHPMLSEERVVWSVCDVERVV